ncbi:16049_t:CDS:2, partial [Racocetra fulgida]
LANFLIIAKRSRKHENLDKQRDRGYIEHFDCNATIDLCHTVLHKRLDRFNTSNDIKAEIKKNIHQMPADIFRQLEQQHPNLTQKQVHAWWTYFLKKEYLCDDNQLISTKILVEENEYKVTNSIDDNDNESMQIFKEYKSVLSDALKIVQEQENANNIQ